MLREDAPAANSPVKVKEPHFKVFPAFKNASYAERYNQLLTRLVRKRLYDAGCLRMSSRKGGAKGVYGEPHPELNVTTLLTSSLAWAVSVARPLLPDPPSTPRC